MAKMMRKTLALVLALALCLSQMALPVLAQTTEPETPVTPPAPAVTPENPQESGAPVINPDGSVTVTSGPVTNPDGSVTTTVTTTITGENQDSFTETITTTQSTPTQGIVEEVVTEVSNTVTEAPATQGGVTGTEYIYGTEGTTTTTTTVETPNAEGSQNDVVLEEDAEEDFDDSHLNAETAESVTTGEPVVETQEGEGFAPAGEATGTQDEDFTNEGEAETTIENESTTITPQENIVVDPLVEVDAEGNPVTDPNGQTKTQAELEFTTETEIIPGEGSSSGGSEGTGTGEEGESTIMDRNFTPAANQEFIGIQVGSELVVLDAGEKGDFGWVVTGSYDPDEIIHINPELDENGEPNGTIIITVDLEEERRPQGGGHHGFPGQGSGSGSSKKVSTTVLTPADFAAMGIKGKVLDMKLNRTLSTNSQADRYDNIILDATVTVMDEDGNISEVDIINGVAVTDSYKTPVTVYDVVPEEYVDNDDYIITEELDAAGAVIGWTVTPKEATVTQEAQTTYSEVTEGSVTYSEEVSKIVSDATMDAMAADTASGVEKLTDANGNPYYQETTRKTVITNDVGEIVELTPEEIALYDTADVTNVETKYTPPTPPAVPANFTDENGNYTSYHLEAVYDTEDPSKLLSYKLTTTVTDPEGNLVCSDTSETFGTTVTTTTITVTDPETKQVSTATKTTLETVKTYVFTETSRTEITDLSRTETTTTSYSSTSETYKLAEGSQMYFEFQGTMYPVEDLDTTDDLEITAITGAGIALDGRAAEAYTYTDGNGNTKTAQQYNASVSFTLNLTESAMNSDDLIAEVFDGEGNSLGKYRLTEKPSWGTNMVDMVTGTEVAEADGNTYTLTGLTLANGVPFTVTLTDPTAGSYRACGGNAANVAAENGADLEFDMVFTVTEPEFTHTSTTTTYDEVTTQEQTSEKKQEQKKTDLTITTVETEYEADRTAIVIRGDILVTEIVQTIEKAGWFAQERGFEADETEPTATEPQETIPEETEPGETIPEETEPQETVPQETQPQETVPGGPQPRTRTIPEGYIPEDVTVQAPENNNFVWDDGIVEEDEAEEDDEIVIEDEEVPLANAPHTGDISGLWAAISVFSLGGSAMLSRKRKED